MAPSSSSTSKLSREDCPLGLRKRRTALTLLQTPCLTNIDRRLIKGGKNSDYKGRPINLADVRAWDDFFSVEEIESIWEDNPTMEV
jgi:hypothetical protein